MAGLPEDGDGVRGAVRDRGGLPGVLDRGALGRHAGVRALRLDVRVDDPRRPTYECGDCDHQTSLTAGTTLEKTRKPLKVWFRAVFEISTRRTGISAMDLRASWGSAPTRRRGPGCTSCARAGALEREPLGPFVQVDEALVGGKGGPHKELVLVAAEADGRVRLAHAETMMRPR